jgi:2-oxoisovalerate dehydrogenase E1 component alpha subunit
VDEVKDHARNGDPVLRVESFLREFHVIEERQSTTMVDHEKLAVLKAMERAESKSPPPLRELFQDVYFQLPKHLIEQEHKLKEHIGKHKGKYS